MQGIAYEYYHNLHSEVDRSDNGNIKPANDAIGALTTASSVNGY